MVRDGYDFYENSVLNGVFKRLVSVAAKGVDADLKSSAGTYFHIFSVFLSCPVLFCLVQSCPNSNTNPILRPFSTASILSYVSLPSSLSGGGGGVSRDTSSGLHARIEIGEETKGIIVLIHSYF